MDVCCDLASELSRIRLNSDRGTQYTSSLFQKWCAANQVTQSMGAVGLFWDNTVAEIFFSQMKTEMYYQHEFENHLTARTAVMEYIESWYNRRRPHSRNATEGSNPRSRWPLTATPAKRLQRRRKINQIVSIT